MVGAPEVFICASVLFLFQTLSFTCYLSLTAQIVLRMDSSCPLGPRTLGSAKAVIEATKVVASAVITVRTAYSAFVQNLPKVLS